MFNSSCSTLSSQHETPLQRENERQPQEYLQAGQQPGASAYVEVCGARIHYLSWNIEQSDKTILLFIHGFRAHAHWWDAIMPFFLERYRCIAMDFSGMGDSDRREAYSPEIFADEICGLIDALDVGPVIAIAHSYGGARLLRACADRPELFQQAIVIDSFMHFADMPRQTRPNISPVNRIYPDVEEACTHFRLMPPQPGGDELLLDYMARHSLREVSGGWSWKFDAQAPLKSDLEIDARVLLPRISTPVSYIYGEHSKVVSPGLAARIVEFLPNARGPIMISGGHHHLMFDQPQALVSTLNTLLTGDERHAS